MKDGPEKKKRMDDTERGLVPLCRKMTRKKRRRSRVREFTTPCMELAGGKL